MKKFTFTLLVFVFFGAVSASSAELYGNWGSPCQLRELHSIQVVAEDTKDDDPLPREEIQSFSELRLRRMGIQVVSNDPEWLNVNITQVCSPTVCSFSIDLKVYSGIASGVRSGAWGSVEIWHSGGCGTVNRSEAHDYIKSLLSQELDNFENTWREANP